jgi:hypothetical protein
VAARAAQDAADARQQLARAEGLGQVVVGAHFQADDAVDLVGTRGEHDHRQARFHPQVAA